MIPILYEKGESDFSTCGLGPLDECLKALVTEERNGSFELSFEYPMAGRLFSYLTPGAIVSAKPNETEDDQLFRIYKASKPLRGVVSFSASHISYDLAGFPLPPFSLRGVTPAEAMMHATQLASNTSGVRCPFAFSTNIFTEHAISFDLPLSLRALLGGKEGSLLDTYGGEYKFDNFMVSLLKSRGEDNGVTVEYGKNLTDLKQEENISDSFTHLFPYAVPQGTEGESGAPVTLPEGTIPIPNAPNLGHFQARTIDLSDRFGEGEAVTAVALREKAKAYLSSESRGQPSLNLTVSFAQLWKTEEGKRLAPLEKVKLCDTVTVRFPPLGVYAKCKVIKTVYDVLGEKYESLTLGDPKSSLADTLLGTLSDVDQVKKAQATGESRAAARLREAIKRATDAITGQSGGYIVMNPPENPRELLLLDAPSIEEANNVWRMNLGGFGHSKNGYNGPYGTAITMDGQINADFITAGELNGVILTAGTVSAEKLSIDYRESVERAISESAEALSQQFSVGMGELRSSIEKKVDGDEFGTLLEQNYEHVRISWNKISKYIEFASGALKIYESADGGQSNLLIELKANGICTYKSGSEVGRIGTNYWVGHPSHRGLVFDLQPGGSYMTWAKRDSPDDTDFTTILCYGRNGSLYGNEGLHLGCAFYGHNNIMDGVDLRNISTNGIRGWSGSVPLVTSLRADDDGSLHWTTSSLTVTNGIITAGPAPIS